MMKKKYLSCFLCAALACLFFVSAYGRTVTLYRGGSALSPVYTSLGSALAHVQSGDSLVLSADTFYEHSLRIRGNAAFPSYVLKLSGVSRRTLIDAQGLGRVLHWSGRYGRALYLKDLMLTGGRVAGNGGGICIDSSNSIDIFYEGYVSVSHCRAENGGAIFNGGNIRGAAGSCLQLEYNAADSFGGAVVAGLSGTSGGINGDTIIIRYNNAYYGGGVSGRHLSEWVRQPPRLGFFARQGFVQQNTAVYGGAFFNTTSVGGPCLVITGNQALLGAAVYGAPVIHTSPTLSSGSAYIYNPRPDGSRQNEIYAHHYLPPGADYYFQLLNCWFGDSDTSGLFDYDRSSGKGIHSGSIFRYTVIDWELNEGKPVGFSPSFPLTAKFRINTGDTLSYGAFPMLEAKYFSSPGSFSPSVAPMGWENTISSLYTASSTGLTDLMGVVDADTFRIRQSVTGIASSGLESVRVYPVPASVFLHIDGVPSSGEALLYDVRGCLSIRQSLSAGRNVLQTGSLPAGVYMLHLKSADGVSGSVRIEKR